MDKERVAKKVLSLLRLSQDKVNENESELAGRTAEKLIKKYNLGVDDLAPFLEAERRAARPTPQPRQPGNVVVVWVSNWGSASTTNSSTTTSSSSYPFYWSV